MEKLLLLKTPKNQILGEIQSQELDHQEFWWNEIIVGKVPGFYSAAIVSQLVHKPTGYNCIFDMRGEPFWVNYSPGRETPKVHETCDNWEHLIRQVRLWISNVKREYEAPDHWASISEVERFVDEVSQVQGESFSESEMADLAEALGQINEFILKNFDQQKEQIDFVAEKMEYLNSTLKQMSRKDWLHTAIGVLFTITVGIGLAPQETGELFRFAGHVIGSIIRKGSCLEQRVISDNV